MTKEDFYSLFIYASMAAIVLVTGFMVVRPAMESGYLAVSAGSNFAFLLISLLIGILLNVLLVEVGHFIGAKIGGYTVLSFNILGLCFYKKEVAENKYVTKFRFKSFDGFTGETKIAPKKEKANPMVYVFLPLFLMLLEFVVLYCVLSFIKDSKEESESILMFVKYGTIVVSAVAGCFIVYDYFPARIDSLNDGYRLVLLNKKINIDAYNTNLSYEAAEFFGKEIKEYKTYDVITDFTAGANLEVALKECRELHYDNALKVIDTTIVDPKKLSRATLEELLKTKAYIYFLTKPLEEAKKFYEETFTSDQVSTIRSCKKYSSIRLYVLFEGLVETSRSEIEYAKQRADKLDKRYEEGEIAKERKLIDIALEKIYEVNPGLKMDVTKKEVKPTQEKQEEKSEKETQE